MVSALRYVSTSFCAAALLLSPVALAGTLVTGSLIKGFALALLAWAAWNWPGWVLFGLVATMPLVRSWSSTLLHPAVILQTKMVIALSLGALWAARRAVSRDELAFPPWLVVFLSAWLALTVLAVLHGVDWAVSLQYLSLTAAGVCVFCVSFHLEPRQKRRILWAAVIVGGLVGCVVLLQYLIVVHGFHTPLARYIVEPRTAAYYGSNLSPMDPARYRPTGTMSHPNTMGFYFALMIPFAFSMLRTRGLRLRERAVLAGSLLTMAFGLYATNSRGSIVCLIISIAYLAWHAGYRWLWGCALGGGLIGAAFLALSPSRQTIVDDLLAKTRVQHGLSGRGVVWKNTWEMARQAPLLGVGPGNFSRQYVSNFGYFVPIDASERGGQIWAIQTLGEQVISNFHAHNIYLQLLGEAGLGGPLLFLTGVFLVIGRCERVARWKPAGSYARAVALATAANAAGLLVYGFFDSHLGFPIGSINLLAGALLAIGLNPDAKRVPHG